MIILTKQRRKERAVKTNIRELKNSEISSEIFVIAPTQIDFISKTFGEAVAEAMNIRPLTDKIQAIAHETLVSALHRAKTMGEQGDI